MSIAEAPQPVSLSALLFAGTEVSTEWMSHPDRQCSHQFDDPEKPNPWWLSYNHVVVINGAEVRTDFLINAALMLCKQCPVQWDCARFAVKTRSYGITYGMKATDLSFLQEPAHLDQAIGWIDSAEHAAEPVQVMVKRRRREVRDLERVFAVLSRILLG